MRLTVYSVVMALLWFTIAALLGSVIMRKSAKIGLALMGSIFVLALVRIFVPLGVIGSVTIRSTHIYPFLQQWSQAILFEDITNGQALLIVWMLGAMIRLLWLARNLMIQWKFCSETPLQENGSWLMNLAERVCHDMGYKGRVRLAVSPSALTAYQAGFMCPFILLPKNAAMFSDQDICYMMHHELGHFLGGDLWIKLGLEIMTCVLWWNPVMIILNRSVEQLLEMRCDQRACKELSEQEQLDYLETFVTLVRANGRKSVGLAMGYGGNAGEGVVQRFERVLKYRPTPATNAVTLTSVVLCIVLFVSSYYVVVQPYTLPPIADIEGENVGVDVTYNFITRSSSGELVLFIDGEYAAVLSEADLAEEPYCNYDIYDIDE